MQQLDVSRILVDLLVLERSLVVVLIAPSILTHIGDHSLHYCVGRDIDLYEDTPLYEWDQLLIRRDVVLGDQDRDYRPVKRGALLILDLDLRSRGGRGPSR